MKVFLNGKIVDEKDAVVSVFDHGLLYGDGIFEGTRVYNGRIAFLDEHIDRLFDSAKTILLDIGMTKDEIKQATVDICKANSLKEGYMRHVVTRGVGNLGLNPYSCKKAQVIIIAAGIKLYSEEMYQNGLKIITAGTIRNMAEAVNPRVKSLNYLNNIMAKIEAINSGVEECLLLNAQGYVAEASGDNVFAIKDNKLLTPATWCGALDGVTRNVVMKLAAEMGMDVVETVLTRYELWTADEMFLTGTAAEVIAVVELDKRPIGDGKPGPKTQQLIKAYRNLVNSTGTPVE
ncbi:MAG: branched-chain-amino-acid transaminase [Kiritimatiellales bacterium]